jgi:hypothetical protein
MSVTDALRAAETRKQAKRRRLKALGQWQPFVDAEPVRQHLRKINDAGMPFRAIALRLDLVSDTSLTYVMWGRGRHGPGDQVRRETAELVLAYWPKLEDFPDAARIDSTGTRRRVQALLVRGWSRGMIARKIGMVDSNFRRTLCRDRVTARFARKIAEVYDAWWDQDPLEHGMPRQPVVRARQEAARAGYQSALAWDEDTIDDPAAVPATDAVQPVVSEGGNLAARYLAGESVVLSTEARKEVLAHRFEWSSLTIDEIAAELGMTSDAAEQAWSRMKRAAREQGQRLWRRVYVRQERALNKDEMEEAA